MQLMWRNITILTLVSSLGVSGCSNLTPGQNAVLAAVTAGAATAVPLGCSRVNPGIIIPVSFGAAALAGGITYFYAKRQATLEQQRIAQQRASEYYASLDAQNKARVGRYLAVNTSSTSQNQGQPIMLYDTMSGTTVGNTVYDVKSTPSTGVRTALDSTQATYIGVGQ